MTNLQDVANAIEDLEHRCFMSGLKSYEELRSAFQAKGLVLTYGESRSFDIARHHGVSAEQFANLPTREERMNWLENRMKLLSSDSNHLGGK